MWIVPAPRRIAAGCTPVVVLASLTLPAAAAAARVPLRGHRGTVVAVVPHRLARHRPTYVVDGRVVARHAKRRRVVLLRRVDRRPRARWHRIEIRRRHHRRLIVRVAAAAKSKTAPTIVLTQAPADPTTATTATFTFTVDKGTTSCSLDGAAAYACTGTTTVRDLTAGAHRFRITAAYRGVSSSLETAWTISPPPLSAPEVSSTPQPETTTSTTTTSTTATPDTQTVDTTQTSSSAAAPSGPLGNPGTWSLAFDDEFDGSALDRAKWSPNWFGPSDGAVTPPPNSAQVNSDDPAQVSVGNGVLAMGLTPESSTAYDGTTFPYRGSLVQTDRKFNFTYGHMEARVKLVGAGGDGSDLRNWMGFWADGETWPATGEIDMMEVSVSDGGVPTTNFHYDGGGGADAQIGNQAVSGVKAGWHVIGADWENGRIDWYYDGVKVRSLTSSAVTSAPMYVILENGAKSTATSNVAPSAMLIDYVRVWRRA